MDMATAMEAMDWAVMATHITDMVNNHFVNWKFRETLSANNLTKLIITENLQDTDTDTVYIVHLVNNN